MTPYERTNLIISVVALAVSVIAVAVSGLTLYFSFFHRRAQLVGALVHINELTTSVFDIELEYVLCNTGNVQLLLKNIEAKKTEAGTDPKVSGVAILQSTHTASLPLVVEPHSTKLVVLRLQRDDLRVAREHSERCFVAFELISARGKFYEAWHEFTKIEVQFEPKYVSEALEVTFPDPEVWKLFKLKRTN